MADQGATTPAPPPIDQPLYTMATLPAASTLPQRFVQVSDSPGVGNGLTQCKVRVTRGQASVASLLGLTILSFPASVGATWVSIVALA